MYTKQNNQRNLQFNQLLFSFYDRTKSIIESIAFEKWMFIASDFLLEQEVHHHNFKFLDNTGDVKVPMLMMKFQLEPCSIFFLILSSSS